MNKVLGIVGGLTGIGSLGGGVAYLILNNSQTSNTSKQQTTDENTEPKNSNTDLENKNKTTTSKSSISSLFEKNSLKLLEKGSDSAMVAKWKEKWGTFKSKYDSLKEGKNWILEDWDNQHKQAEEAPDAFKDKCINNASKEVENENDPLYIAVKDYCTETKTPPVAGDT